MMTYPAYQITKNRARVIERFMSFVVKRHEDDGGCWEWTGYICKRGYPHFWVSGRSSALAHRVSYALFKGRIRSGKVIDHKCCNTRCVNPDHVQATSQSNNVKRARRLSI
jgi:hypothetical protein